MLIGADQGRASGIVGLQLPGRILKLDPGLQLGGVAAVVARVGQAAEQDQRADDRANQPLGLLAWAPMSPLPPLVNLG